MLDWENRADFSLLNGDNNAHPIYSTEFLSLLIIM